MKRPSVLALFLACGLVLVISFVAQSLIGYTNGSEESVLEIAEEEFRPEDREFLRAESRMEETAEGGFDAFKDHPLTKRHLAR